MYISVFTLNHSKVQIIDLMNDMEEAFVLSCTFGLSA